MLLADLCVMLTCCVVLSCVVLCCVVLCCRVSWALAASRRARRQTVRRIEQQGHHMRVTYLLIYTPAPHKLEQSCIHIRMSLQLWEHGDNMLHAFPVPC